MAPPPRRSAGFPSHCWSRPLRLACALAAGGGAAGAGGDDVLQQHASCTCSNEGVEAALPPLPPPPPPPPPRRAPRRGLREIFEAAGTDKASMHGYHRFYERELAPYRETEGLRLLEIGVGGGHSLLAWSEYFASLGALQGLDRARGAGDDAEAKRRRVCELLGAARCGVVRVHVADQGNETQLRAVVAAEPLGWDLIIDDGSHVPAHQVISFRTLFPALRPGGLYVVEDLTSSYQDRGEISGYPLFGGVGARYPGSAVEMFKELVDVAMRGHFLSPQFTVFGQHVDSDVARVGFGDGIVFIEKRPLEEDWNRFYPPPAAVWWQIPNFVDMALRAEDAAQARRQKERPIEKALEEFRSETVAQRAQQGGPAP